MSIGTKENNLLLDAPLSPSGLFGTSAEAVVDKFREVKAQSVAFRSIPHQTRSSPKASEVTISGSLLMVQSLLRGL